MTTTLLLFDVDGTLLLTGGAGMRAMQRVAARLFGETFRWDGIDVSGHLDPLIFAEAAALNGLPDDPRHHVAFRDGYLVALAEELEAARAAIRVMPGIRETLEKLRRRPDVTLGLLTGNYTSAIPLKLGAIGVDPSWFTVTAFGDEGASRADLVALALDKYRRLHGREPHAKHVLVVGDTPRDVACAHAHGCLAFGVATGRFSTEELRRAGADFVAPDLSDPRPLFDLLNEWVLVRD